MKKRNRHQQIRTLQTLLWTVVILIQMTVIQCLEVQAETDIILYSEIERRKEEWTKPEEEYEDEYGNQYILEKWSVVPVAMPATRRQVMEARHYEGVEGTTKIPDTIEVMVRHPELDETITGICTVEKKEILLEKWEEGFTFIATFHTYGADFYQLGDSLIPFDEETPRLEGREEQLLELMGLPKELYQVTYLQWVGEPYTDEEGVMCRDAAAFGKKLVRDYRVDYVGILEFPSWTGWQRIATYKRMEETVAATEAVVKVILPKKQPEAEEIIIQEVEESQVPLTLWQKITSTLGITIAIGGILFLGGLFILLCLRVEKKFRAWYNRRKNNKTGGTYHVHRKL